MGGAYEKDKTIVISIILEHVHHTNLYPSVHPSPPVPNEDQEQLLFEEGFGRSKFLQAGH